MATIGTALAGVSGNLGGYCAFFGVLLMAGCIYLMPAMMAYEKQYMRAAQFCLLNILLGWLLIPWIYLAWRALRMQPGQA